MKVQNRGPPAASPTRRKPRQAPFDAEAGVRRVHRTATPTERFTRVKRVVVEIGEAIPVTDAEVDFLLHWTGDLAADLMNDDDVGG